MNTTPSQRHPASKRRRRRAVALVTVLSVLSLTMILITAMLSVTRVEHKATVSQVEGDKARLHADSVINLVIGQIQSVTRQDTAKAGREIWTSQPGMVRQYEEDGTLLRGAKLFSVSQMIATTEAEVIADVPPVDWDQRQAQYVDLNEPVVRADLRNPEGRPRVYFPIIDPRAYSTDPNKSVEAFSYSKYANGTSGQALNGVVLPTGNEDAQQRLPMPVEWLYMLKDGTLGSLNDEGKFTAAGDKVATRDNPIIARVAFWTDDESTKININTAGEGTFWSTPRLYHDRDGEWARFQPMGYEYQRYPGHPATVCMSTVLFPNQRLNPLVTEGSAFTKALNFKEAIYDLMPKILPGGSKAGSVLVPVGRENYTPTDFKNVQEALAERLFPSTDEFLLRAGAQDGQRQEIDLGVGQLWTDLDTSEIVERLRPFLTPRSRAPETNPFGLPKISMWPVHRNTTPQYRTVYDRTIANVSTLAGREYFFTRMDNTSKAELSSGRNSQLFNYLMALTDQPIPGFGEASATFAKKYGDNRQQILLEMFDYIRSTNLYDDGLAEDNVGKNPTIASLPDARTKSKFQAGYGAKTFTPMRNTTGTTYPGHGEVVPTVLARGKGDFYRGMGRIMTVSEVGLHFIACAEGSKMADGKETAGGVSTQKINAKSLPEVPYTAPTWRGGVWGQSEFWYSNFPPLSVANQDPASGFYKNRYPEGHKLEGIEGDQPNHPGYNPANWNWTLDEDTPLLQGKKRVQAAFLLEWFSPSAGWTIHNPNIAIRVDASRLTVGGRKMFPAAKPTSIIRPFKHMSAANGVYQRGGTVSYRAFLQERKLPAIAKGVNGCSAGSIRYPDTNIPDDKGAPYSGGVNYDTYAQRSDELKECNQYNLVSDFFDVDADGTIPFDGGTVKLEILTNETSPDVLQTFEFVFPKGNFPAPQLMLKSEDTTRGQRADGTYYANQPVPAPYWWSFHSDGALGRNNDGKISKDAAIPKSRMGGRFRYIGNEIGNYTVNSRYYRGSLALPVDTIQSLVLKHGDPRLTMGQYQVPSSEFQQHRYYGVQPMAHNIVFRNWSEGPGLDRGEDKKGWRLVKDATYAASYIPDHPYTAACGAGLQKYGDFDRGITSQTDGAYINKPDEGNTHTTYHATSGEQLVPYFSESYTNHQGGPTYFSPNRQISSPGMFGSLPTGVLEGGSTGAAGRREPWRTLLFRPQHVRDNALGLQAHVGAAKTLKGWGSGGRGLNIGGIDPPDHLLMDFFWMPVIEPYAISAPGSTAGKINLNYQMAPFRHIQRATGLAAVMKSELVTAVAKTDAGVYLSQPSGAPSGGALKWFWKEDASSTGRKFWHRQIDIPATLKLFEERFSFGFNFISPAQICEMYLLPKRMNSADTLVPATWPQKMTDLMKVTGNSMGKFWADHAITAENLKERPYANIYPRVTTRSNTFQVHMRVQSLKKARSSDPEVFVPGVDQVTSEYRGSAVVERYLDLNDPALDTSAKLDYASGSPLAKEPLDHLHRFRVIAQKRFNP
ncbi:MAG: Verru_Chthon cassette protein A [Prosthecobacter sp.]